MIDFKIIETEKNTEIKSLKTLKVLKTIPISYTGNKNEFVLKWFGKLTFEKRLKETLKKIKKKEPYVFELIKSKEILGARFVNLKDGYRFELVYLSGEKIKIDELLYELCENKIKEVYLNY
jgi:hypothetical protein